MVELLLLRCATLTTLTPVYLPLPCPLVHTAEEVMHFLGQHITVRDCAPLSPPLTLSMSPPCYRPESSKGGATISVRP